MRAPETVLTANTYYVTHTVGPHQDGIRLDAFLKDRYKKRSREQIKAAIADGSISLSRAHAPHLTAPPQLKPASILIPGDQVLVRSERKPEPEVNFDYRILFEDDALLVIDKPPHLPVHPAGRYFFNTLLTHLRTGGHTRPLDADHDYYLAHRLDKETSGVMVLTKSPETCTHLTRQFSSRTTRKQYLAIVHGWPKDDHFENAAPMKRSSTSPIDVQMEICPEDDPLAQTALTEFEVIQRLEFDPTTRPTGFDSVVAKPGLRRFSVIRCYPRTGRQHQIRLHLDHLEFPIVGDKLYGMPVLEALHYYDTKHITPEAQARLLLSRHALHAARLEFIHPITQKPMVFDTPLPPDLSAFIS